MIIANNSKKSVENTPTDEHNQFGSITQYVSLEDASQTRVIPPLAQWNPQHCGKMDLVIKANGEWWHEGSLIKRQRMLDLFSKVLWPEAGKYYLKTPVEKIEITVEDVPLLVNQVDQIQIDGQVYLQLTTTNQDVVIIDAEHPIFMREYQGEMRPYVHVRFGLNALIQRQAFYHLLNFGELTETPNGDAQLRLQSGDLVLHLGT